MKKRTLLSMLLMLAMTLSLVGCGSDEKKPTSTDTAVNGTEATTDVAEKPTEVETPTPEPEKNVITLMSADGKKVIHEFDIPDGYTVVSDKKSNHVELAKDGDDTIKVEIISGPCAEALSTIYQYVDGQTAKNNPYAYGGTYCYYGAELAPSGKEFIYVTEDKLNSEIDKIATKSGIDKKYFTQKFSNTVAFHNEKYGYNIVASYPEQHNLEKLERLPEDNWGWSLHWDFSDHKDSNTYPITYYCYNYMKDYNYITADETFTIKVTTTFDENKYNESNPYDIDNIIQEKIGDYAKEGEPSMHKFLEANFNMNTHKCDHCK